MRFCELPISIDFHDPVPGSRFSWGGQEHLVRIGTHRAVGPHPNQQWIFNGDELVQAERTGKDKEWR